MDCKINWTQRAWETYKSNIDYLKKSWTQKEITRFVLIVDDKLNILSAHQKIGTSKNKKFPNIRSTFIHKRIILIYKYKPLKKEIDLLIFWNTYQNPRKLKVK